MLLKQDQEPKSATTYAPKQTSHAHAHLLDAKLAKLAHATDFNIDLYANLTLIKIVKLINKLSSTNFFLHFFKLTLHPK